jgi:ketosteroid isomerase-like protein
MIDNITTIKKFYTSFQELNHEGMNSCYADNIVFSDPVFGLLEGEQVKAMWRMLCTRAKNFSLQYHTISTDDNEYYTCEWIAQYTFSKTGRTIVNKCKAYMRLKDGIIIEHSDAFNYYRWVRQALGLRGLLFGWSGYMHNKVVKNAKRELDTFMKG